MATKPKAKQQKRSTTSKRAHATTARSTGRTKSAKSEEQSTLGKTAAKMLAGAASAVRALVPQLDAQEGSAAALLEGQHREVEQLFETALGTDDARVRRQAMNEITRQLTTHTAIEEEIYYPAVKGLDTEKAKDMILEAYEEHHVVKLILKELPKVDPKADTFEAKMTVLKELIQHHVEEEEREMFPMAESQLGPERSRELAEAMAERAARK